MFFPLREVSAVVALVTLAVVSVQGFDTVSKKFDRRRIQNEKFEELSLSDSLPRTDEELTQRWNDALQCSAFMYRNPTWRDLEQTHVHPGDAL